MKDKHDVLVYRNEFAYSSWPDVKVLRDGDWVVVFCEAMRRSSITHLDPTALSVLLRSKDGGKTWEGFPHVVGGYDFCGMDDPGLVELSNGDLLVNTFQKHLIPREMVGRTAGYEGYRRVKPFTWAFGYSGSRTYVHRSRDRGHTWSETVEVRVAPFGVGCTLRSIVELEDSTLLLPCYDESQNPCPAFVARSQDWGETWGEASVIARDERISFYEPALLSLPGGTIICMLRTHEPGGHHLYQCVSRDGGRSWSHPKKTPIRGYPAHLLRLRDGRVLCVYGYRWEPFGIRGCLSHDDGDTWEAGKEFVLRDDFPNRDLGYPTSVELENGKIFTVYYGQDEGGVTCIHGSFYRI